MGWGWTCGHGLPELKLLLWNTWLKCLNSNSRGVGGGGGGALVARSVRVETITVKYMVEVFEFLQFWVSLLFTSLSLCMGIVANA